jgi:transposase
LIFLRRKINTTGGDKVDWQKVIIQLLGLQDVVLTDAKLFQKDLKAEFTVEQNRSSESCCRECSEPLGKIKEWFWRRAKIPPVGVYNRVVVRYKTFRAWCPKCRGNRQAQVVWLHFKHRSMTAGFVETAGRLMTEATCEASGRLMGGIHSMQMMRVDQTRMNQMLQNFKIPNVNYSSLSADEIHFKTIKLTERKGLWAKRWDREWITNLVSVDYNKKEQKHEGKVLFNAVGRGKAALRDCFSVLSPGQKMAVEWFCCDMHEPFIQGAKIHLPNAKICVDRFHVVQLANKAFDQVRKMEIARAESEFQKAMLLPSKRFILVSREKDLSKAELKQLDRLRQENQNINTAMVLVEFIHKAFDKTNLKSFRQTLKNWYLIVRESGLEPFLQFAKTIRKYRKLIENYIISRLTTAVSEGLNNKIKALKRAGYGYSSKTYFRNKILQKAGYLNHYYIPTDHLLLRNYTK